MRPISRFMRDAARAVLGPPSTWGLRSRAGKYSQDFPARLEELARRASPASRAVDDQPVFLLSAGWRSGSTLLQRMIMENNDDILIWGEPFSHCNLFDTLIHQFRAFADNWPPNAFLLSRTTLANISDSWVANLYPPIDQLIAAHRRFYACLFAEPAHQAGRRHWGFKEVRLTIDHAAYLRFLYPRCKIVFLCRDPRDAYLSYRNWDSGWFRTWPERPISTPYAFGRNWAELLTGFLESDARVDAVFIRYEDLDDPIAVERLQSYLGWPVPRSSMMRRIRTPQSDGARETVARQALPLADRLLLNIATRTVRRQVGYSD